MRAVLPAPIAIAPTGLGGDASDSATPIEGMSGGCRSMDGWRVAIGAVGAPSSGGQPVSVAIGGALGRRWCEFDVGRSVDSRWCWYWGDSRSESVLCCVVLSLRCCLVGVALRQCRCCSSLGGASTGLRFSAERRCVGTVGTSPRCRGVGTPAVRRSSGFARNALAGTPASRRGAASRCCM